ncbi:hypothetical protein EPUS_08595 [Endocarpon pusillum Z07020]|uniref:DNA2/NAM7 helicase-like C-terminal domain-containing protein n=1 Tax=Endocarpon pusillum (strain Z07020 / HMAS-L-300199) TaxID=1263415 RepID=U1GEK5_ENDPU|nr:uncharacterized protein EPUS_08595 [Endocarpon pusillum Z07020]ERF70533.1 hypothetical protein EPUS_08595 [Endocarpon pusillum Z07020]
MTVEHKAFSDVFRERYGATVVSQYYFINTTRSIAHVQAGGNSLENWADAKVAVILCKAWIEKGILAIKIAILCFYHGQIDVVNEYLKRYGISGVQVVSVDQFQSGDNDFTISLVTATANKSLMTLLSGDPDYFQGVSVFVKLYKRLNVAATRAKKGHVFIGSATTLDRAVQKEASGEHLRALIHDAIERRVMLIDETEDESPYVQQHLMSSDKTLREFKEETSSLENLGWMSEHREGRVQILRKAHQQKPQKVTYGGSDQATQFGTFPPNVKEATRARQSQPGAVRWSDEQREQRESSKKKGKKRR